MANNLITFDLGGLNKSLVQFTETLEKLNERVDRMEAQNTKDENTLRQFKTDQKMNHTALQKDFTALNTKLQQTNTHLQKTEDSFVKSAHVVSELKDLLNAQEQTNADARFALTKLGKQISDVD